MSTPPPTDPIPVEEAPAAVEKPAGAGLEDGAGHLATVLDSKGGGDAPDKAHSPSEPPTTVEETLGEAGEHASEATQALQAETEADAPTAIAALHSTSEHGVESITSEQIPAAAEPNDISIEAPPPPPQPSELEPDEQLEVPDAEAAAAPEHFTEEEPQVMETAAEEEAAVDPATDIGFVPRVPDGQNGADPIEALKRSPPVHTSSFPVVPHPVDAPQEGETASALSAGANQENDNNDDPFGTVADVEDDFFGSRGGAGGGDAATAKVDEHAETSNLFPEDAGNDDFFGSVQDGAQQMEQPKQADTRDFFANTASHDDFFNSAQNDALQQHPQQVERVDSFTNDTGISRSQTADIVMGGNPQTTEPDRFEEGMPLFGGEETTEDDFFSKAPNTSGNDEGSAFFDNSRAALERKTTNLAAGAVVSGEGKAPAKEEDLAARWGAVLDDDEFLEDEEDGAGAGGTAAAENEAAKSQGFDPSGFFADDGEGFLSDDDDTQQVAPAPTTTSTAAAPLPAPAPAQAQAPPTNQYAGGSRYAPATAVAPSLTSPPSMSPYQAAFNRQAQPPQAEPKKQSFVAQTGGYHSPYDLPDDYVKPVQRRAPPAPQNFARQGQIPGGDAPRGREGFGVSSPPPPPPKGGLTSPPMAHASLSGGAVPAKPKAASQAAQFFEELPTIPIQPRSGSASRYTPNQRAPSGGYTPPVRNASVGHLPNGQTPQVGLPMGGVRPSSIGAAPMRPPSVDQGRYSPAITTHGAPQPQPGGASRYAPASNPMYSPQPAAASLYAAPPQQRGTSPYAPRPAGVSVPARTSSISREAGPPSGDSTTATAFPGDASDTSSTKDYPRPPSSERPGSRDRPPSRDRPGTMESLTRDRGASLGEVAEEDEEGRPNFRATSTHAPPPPRAPSQSYASKYAPSSRSSTSTPPPQFGSAMPSKSKLASPPPAGSSPSKYTPSTTASTGYPTPASSHSAADTQFAPPRRSQTQSPGVAAMRTSIIRDPYQRPSSAAASHLPYGNASAQHQSYPAAQAPQTFSLPFMPPHPDSPAAQDPLQRWKGCPVFCWGFGGTVVTMFPARTQRWNAESREQMIKSSPGEVKLKQSKEMMATHNFITEAGTFPGPFPISKGGNKSKKKDLLSWMEERIKGFESAVLGADHHSLTRMEEKVLLWKLVKVCLENDGVMVGTKEIEKVVRDILNPFAESQSGSFSFPAAPAAIPHPLDPEVIKAIRAHLLRGDRESAVWYGIERNQWAHAMLIASTVSPELFKRTVQEFVRQEVKTVTGKGSESLAVLYEVFAGNSEEAVDDLVPPSARMGMTMMSTTGSSGSESTMLERLNLWRETLGLILSNRSHGDADAVFRLGRLLESYGRVEAAHVCYIFANPLSTFGGAEDTQTSFALLGGDHINNPFNYGRDTDAVILSEIYEYAISLPKTSLGISIPHLQSFKLQHAMLLAQYGYKTEAQKYCEAIAQAIKSVPRSPYFNVTFLEKLDDLNKRLAQTPKDSSGSWISRASVDNLSGSMWSTFNKFVAGDDDADKPAGNGTAVESGPFAKIAGNTPGISRSHSPSNSYGGYPQPLAHANPMAYDGGSLAQLNKTTAYQGGGGGKYDPIPSAAAPSASSARYAPRGSVGAAGGQATDMYAPQYSPSHGGGSGSGGYDPPQVGYPGQSMAPYDPQNANPYGPSHIPNSTSATAPNMFAVPQNIPPGGDAQGARTSMDLPPPTAPSDGNAGAEEASSQGYTPFGYEPPSTEFQPYVPSPDASDDEGGASKKSKPKKSFMDDDDDIKMPPAAASKSSKEQEEEENRKMIQAIADQEKKDAEEAKKAKAASGGWFGGWFGGKKDKDMPVVHKAKLGEENSFYYDPDLKKWINKNAKPEEKTAVAAGTPPPPKRINSPASVPGTPPPPGAGAPPPPAAGGSAAGGPPGAPPGPPPSAPPAVGGAGSAGSLLMPPRAGTGPPGPSAGASPAGSRGPSPAPPPRPATTGKLDEMEELLGGGPPGGSAVRAKGGAKNKGRKRYVEVL